MSFLNPVSEPVKRFSSADAGAPQINYNSRVAGDVKAVLKACLVDGYGTTDGAGWSVVNEAGNVAEFVSPSAAMSDYRLGIDDTSASSTTWYYQYQDVRKNPQKNTPQKNFTKIDKVNPDNGWTLLVTERGLFFVEIVWSQNESDLSARLTYWGHQKITTAIDNVENISFFNAGHNGEIGATESFFDRNNRFNKIGSDVGFDFCAALPYVHSPTTLDFYLSNSVVDCISEIFLLKDGVILAQQVGILGICPANLDSLFGIADIQVNNRPAIKLCLGYSGSTAAYSSSRARAIALYLDYWEY